MENPRTEVYSLGMSDSVIIEVRAAEGGSDAKLLVRSQCAIYEKMIARRDSL